MRHMRLIEGRSPTFQLVPLRFHDGRPQGGASRSTVMVRTVAASGHRRHAGWCPIGLSRATHVARRRRSSRPTDSPASEKWSQRPMASSGRFTHHERRSAGCSAEPSGATNPQRKRVGGRAVVDPATLPGVQAPTSPVDHGCAESDARRSPRVRFTAQAVAVVIEFELVDSLDQHRLFEEPGTVSVSRQAIHVLVERETDAGVVRVAA